MEKFYERKNFGIPVTILVLLAYFIGYSMTRSLSGTLLVAILFAGAVFSLHFDDRVKNAIKHSYIFATIVHLVYFVFEIFLKLITAVFGGRVSALSSMNEMLYGVGFFQRGLNVLYSLGLFIVEVAVIVIFALFIIMTLMKKDVNIGLVANILGDAPPKPKNQPPTYQNQQGQQNQYQSPVAPPVAPPQAPVAPPAAPPQAPVAPQEPTIGNNGGCSNCGHVNPNEAVFCASCGAKLK